MITIYRVENDKGRGFYHDGFFGKFPPVQYWYPILRHASCDAQTFFIKSVHPNLDRKHDELAYDEKSNWVFGFVGSKDLHDWFPPFILKDVPKFNGKIIKYHIEKKYVKFFHKQCLFNIEKATIISS
jgi:hypothetical protein